MKIRKLEGLIAAAHTAFNDDGSVNYDTIPAQAAMLIKQKVTGVYISGTTGEGVHCSTAERKKVFDEWVKAAKGKLYLIAHVGSLSLPDTQELAGYAEKIGMDATSIVPPCFFRPGSIQGLIDYLNEALKYAQKTPFYYYHTSMSGVTFDMQKFLEAADGKIKNLAGVKFNYPDLYMYQRCIRCLGGKYDITWGIDEWFAGAVALVDAESGYIPGYEAIDKSPVKIIVLTLASDRQQAPYLQLMSYISRALRADYGAENLVKCKTPDEMRRFFRRKR